MPGANLWIHCSRVSVPSIHKVTFFLHTPFWRSSHFSTLLFPFPGKPLPILDSHLSCDDERHNKSLGPERFPGINLLLMVWTKANYLMSLWFSFLLFNHIIIIVVVTMKWNNTCEMLRTGCGMRWMPMHFSYYYDRIQEPRVWKVLEPTLQCLKSLISFLLNVYPTSWKPQVKGDSVLSQGIHAVTSKFRIL